MKFQVLFSLLILAAAVQGLFLKTALKKKLLLAALLPTDAGSGSGSETDSGSTSGSGSGSGTGSGSTSGTGTTSGSESGSTSGTGTGSGSETPTTASTVTTEETVVVTPAVEQGVEVAERVVYYATPVVYREIRPVVRRRVVTVRETHGLGNLGTSGGDFVSASARAYGNIGSRIGGLAARSPSLTASLYSSL